MALFRMSAAKSIAGESKNCCILAYTRWTHAIAHPPPLDSAISRSAILPPLVLPEFEKNLDTINNQFGSGFHIGSGSMELMAVPKKKDLGFCGNVIFAVTVFIFQH
ncbi:hypothetical protein L2E82_50215 [Cichorium intybus]|nr:hypothetical protein L2E82_50215 [Cichorium intybus]